MSDKQSRLERLNQGPAKIEHKDEHQIESFEFEIISPIFGGGAEAGKSLDEDMPIRLSGILGQLRFWWRVTRGHEYKTLDAMKKMEDYIWGSAAMRNSKGEREGGRGLVSIRIELAKKEDGYRIEEEPIFVRKGNRWDPIKGKEHLAYLAFSAKPNKDDHSKDAMYLMNVKGKHKLIYEVDSKANDNDIKDIEAAFWAWRNFGGIGGRTRRGFGAISSKDDERPEKLLDNNYISHETPIDDIPTLSKNYGAALKIREKKRKKYAREIWEEIAKKYFKFRQCRVGSDYGRSYWPEPDVVRELTGKSSDKQNERRKSSMLINKVPRAIFGMPLIIRLKAEPRKGKEVSCKIQPSEKIERLASSLIVRPGKNSREEFGMGLLLGNRLSSQRFGKEGFFVKEDDKDSKNSEYISPHLTDNEAQNIKPLKGEKDIFKAFFNHLEKNKGDGEL